MFSSVYREMAEKKMQDEVQKLDALKLKLEQMKQNLLVTDKLKARISRQISRQEFKSEAAKIVYQEFTAREDKHYAKDISNPNNYIGTFFSHVESPESLPNVGEKGSFKVMKKHRDRPEENRQAIAQLSSRVKRR
ncbi:MAG TPA: hypothetical protein VHM20_03560 [Gammaproteobacteria bacterium]|jgi:pimeloyl-CoA synthetase|nr:hypothetical protein [Gammaproteobacteria bacterium]